MGLKLYATLIGPRFTSGHTFTLGVVVNTTTNVRTPNASFGQPLATAGQRLIQLALKLTF